MKIEVEGYPAIAEKIDDVVIEINQPHDDLAEFLNGSKLKAIKANFYYYKALLNGDLDPPVEKFQHTLLNNINIFYNQAVNFLKDEKKFTEENLERAFDALKERAGLQPLKEPLLSLLVEINKKIINLDLQASVNLIKNNLEQDSEIQSQSIKEALNDLANEHLSQLKKIWNTFTSKLLPEQVEPLTDQNLASDIQQVSNIVISDYFSELDEEAQTIINESTIGQTYADYLEQDSEKITELVNAMNKAIIELDLNKENTLIALIDSITRINSTLENYMTSFAQTQAINADLRPVMIASLKDFIKNKGLNKVKLPNDEEIEVSKYNLKNLAMLNASLSKIMLAKDEPQITKQILDQQHINLPEAFDGENQGSIFGMTSSVIFGRVQRLTDFLGPYGLEGILDNKEDLTKEFMKTEEMQKAIAKKHKLESDLQKLSPIMRAWKRRNIDIPAVDEEFKKFDENAFSSCIHFLGQDPFIKYGLEFVQDDVDLHKNIPKSKITTFEQLEKIALGGFLDESGEKISPMKERTFTVQAQFKKTISTVKYTLTQEEIDLLNKATGLDLTDGNKSKITFTTAIESIESEISKRDDYNGKKPWYKRELRTDHLKAAIDYLQYYENKYKMTQQPEERLKENQHRSDHKNFIKGSDFREKFSEGLWFPYSENRAIKKLKKILDNKYKRAAELKKHATLLENKAKRNDRVNTDLTLKTVKIEGKEGKLPGKFFDSIIETDRKELEESSYNLWQNPSEGKNLLFQQLVYTDLHHRIKAVKRRIDAFIKNPKLFQPNELKEILGSQQQVKNLATKEFDDLKKLIKENEEKIRQKIDTYISELRSLEQTKLTKANCTDLQFFVTKLNTIFELFAKQYKDNLMTAFLEDRKHSLTALYSSVIQSAGELDLNAHIVEPTVGIPFNPRSSKDALKVVGHLVFDVKVTKKELERNANIFIKLQNATINAVNKTVLILEDIENQSKNGMDPRKLIDEAIKRNEVTSHITSRDPEEMENWSHNYFLDYEFSTIANELNKLRNNKKDLKEAISSTIIALNKELMELKNERDYNQGRIKSLVSKAIETSEAITHLADHATPSLGRNLG